MSTNREAMGSPLSAWIENSVLEVETHWQSDKENVLGAALSKEGFSDS